MTESEKIDLFQQLLAYEISSSWAAHYIKPPILQTWIAEYYVWKTRRKMRAYLRFIEFRQNK